MAIEFNYDENIAKEVESERFETLDPGDYKIRIKEAIEQKSKSGYDQVKLIFEVAGHNALIYHYITFTGEKWVHDVMKKFWTCFGIEFKNMNTQSWIGKVGAAHTKNDEYGSKIHYFLEPSKAINLPNFEGSTPVEKTPDDLPF